MTNQTNTETSRDWKKQEAFDKEMEGLYDIDYQNQTSEINTWELYDWVQEEKKKAQIEVLEEIFEKDPHLGSTVINRRVLFEQIQELKQLKS